MPFYQYRCQQCNTEFEKRLPITDHSLPTKDPCPNCNTYNIEQYVSAVNIGDPVRLGIHKADSAFRREVLGKIKKGNPGSYVDKTQNIPRML